jgi:methylenetetrahydrofolate dehydrogenase (NADP+)/methenyltetrahydrofolate cyclohydrolase
MQTQTLCGKEVAKHLLAEVREELAVWKESQSQAPGLALILVGHYPPSEVYVAAKKKKAEELGFRAETFRFPESISESELLKALYQIQNDPLIHGVLIQLPLPAHLNRQNILAGLDPRKDVDALTWTNLGRLMANQFEVAPCTAHGVTKILDYYSIPVEGKRVVVVGRSLIVGMPLSVLLTHRNATVSLAHSKTKNLSELTSQADICVFAAHQKNLFDRSFVKKGAVVIDVGIHRLEPKGLTGDCDQESLQDWATALTPVPGGVGPVTVAMVMVNLMRLAKLQIKPLQEN